MAGGNRAQPVIDGKKKCTKCGRVLPITSFSRQAASPNGTRAICKDCAYETEKERRRLLRGPNYVDRRARLIVGEDGKKLCTLCGERKPVSEFSPAKMMASGLESRCKQCNQDRTNTYKTNNLHAALACLCHGNKQTNAQRSSKRRKAMVHEIEPEYLIELWHDQHGICAVTGVPMTHVYGQGNIMTNASIDRIDNGIGYTKGNVRLVCYAVNVMRNSMTDDELYRWCRLIVERHENENTQS